MISTQTVKNASRIVCIRSFPYDLPIDLHICIPNGYESLRQIQYSFERKYDDPQLREIMACVLQNKAIKRVWAIVLEKEEKPLFIVRNSIYKNTDLPFRRVLRVNCDLIDCNMIPLLDYYFMLMILIAILSILIANFCIVISFLS